MKRSICLVVLGWFVLALSSFAQTTATISGRPGPNNDNCYANCTKTFRDGNVFRVVALDGDGHVFNVINVDLPAGAKLSAASSNSLSTNQLNGGSKQPNYSNDDIHTETTSKHTVSQDGTLTVITTINTYQGNELIGTKVKVTKYPPGKWQPPRRAS